MNKNYNSLVGIFPLCIPNETFNSYKGHIQINVNQIINTIIKGE
jgi:hypothetical protein